MGPGPLTPEVVQNQHAVVGFHLWRSHREVAHWMILEIQGVQCQLSTRDHSRASTQNPAPIYVFGYLTCCALVDTRIEDRNDLIIHFDGVRYKARVVVNGR